MDLSKRRENSHAENTNPISFNEVFDSVGFPVRLHCSSGIRRCNFLSAFQLVPFYIEWGDGDLYNAGFAGVYSHFGPTRRSQL